MGEYVYKYPMLSATVDLAVFVLDEARLRVLMIRRKNDPFAGQWAFPGGYVEIDEPFEDAARRELKEETGLVPSGPLDFIGVFGRPGRDPRGRTISIAHATVVKPPCPAVKGSDDARDAAWLVVDEACDLAFDHNLILASARCWLADRVEAGAIGVALLPDVFRMADIARLQSAVNGHADDSRAWLDRVLALGLASRLTTRGMYEGSPIETRPTVYAEPFRR